MAGKGNKLLVRRVGAGGTVQVTSSGIEALQQLASTGCSNARLAAFLNVSPKTLSRALERQPEVALAIARGRGELEDEALSDLRTLAKSGEVAAAIFRAKALAGLSDRGESRDRTTGPTVNVQIVLPAAASSLDEYAKIIDADAEGDRG